MLIVRNFSIIIAFVFSSLSHADVAFTVTGYGDNWGQTAVEDAKEEALQLAQGQCHGEVQQITDWEVIILNHKEGKLRASAAAQFRCL